MIPRNLHALNPSVRLAGKLLPPRKPAKALISQAAPSRVDFPELRSDLAPTRLWSPTRETAFGHRVCARHTPSNAVGDVSAMHNLNPRAGVIDLNGLSRDLHAAHVLCGPHRVVERLEPIDERLVRMVTHIESAVPENAPVYEVHPFAPDKVWHCR